MVKEIAGDKVKGMDAVAEAEGKEIQVAAEEEAKEVVALFLGMIPMVMDNLLELNEERVVVAGVCLGGGGHPLVLHCTGREVVQARGGVTEGRF